MEKSVTKKFDKISDYFQTKTFFVGEVLSCRVSHVYDITKFYVVFLDKELTLFGSFLASFYSKNHKRYKMPKSQIKRNSNCVTLVNSGYYRGQIVSIPHFAVRQQKVLVFLFDYGCVVPVEIENLYELDDKFSNVPRFAVRASLNGVQPYNTYMWTSEAVKKFDNLVDNKVVTCEIAAVDTERKTVIINLFEKSARKVQDIARILLEMKVVKPNNEDATYEGEVDGRLIPKIKYPYLFPSFHAVETGKMLSSVETTEYLKYNPVRLSYWKPYFKPFNDEEVLQ